MIPLIADHIIYTIQRVGGVSVVWNELMSRARADMDIDLTELDYRNDMRPRRMERYRVPD